MGINAATINILFLSANRNDDGAPNGWQMAEDENCFIRGWGATKRVNRAPTRKVRGWKKRAWPHLIRNVQCLDGTLPALHRGILISLDCD